MELHFDEGFLQAKVVVEAVSASEHVGADDAKFTNVKIVQTELRSDADAPVDWFEARVAVEEIETEAQSLIEEGLLAAPKETRAAGFGSAYAAWRRNAAAVEKCFRRSGEIQENLLAKSFRPDGLIAFETIAIERIVPVRLRVEILALLRIAAIVRLIESPAIGYDVINVGDRREVFGRKLSDVVGIGIETMAKLAITAERGR